MRSGEGDPPGFLRGQHYTAFVGDVERLVRTTSKGVAAERLLLELIAATEATAPIHHQGVAPWYYEQLANVYHRRGDLGAELALLLRFRGQWGEPGGLRRELLARLKRLAAEPEAVSKARSPSVIRTCAFPDCGIALTPKQTKYCGPTHAQAAGVLGRRATSKPDLAS